MDRFSFTYLAAVAALCLGELGAILLGERIDHAYGNTVALAWFVLCIVVYMGLLGYLTLANHRLYTNYHRMVD